MYGVRGVDVPQAAVPQAAVPQPGEEGDLGRGMEGSLPPESANQMPWPTL